MWLFFSFKTEHFESLVECIEWPGTAVIGYKIIILVILSPSWMLLAIMLILITVELKLFFILKYILNLIYTHDGTFDKDKKTKMNTQVKYKLIKSIKMIIIL